MCDAYIPLDMGEFGVGGQKRGHDEAIPQRFDRYIIRKAFCCHSFFFNSIFIIVITGFWEEIAAGK